MKSETDNQTDWLPDRSKPRFRVQSTEKLETGLLSDDRHDQDVRLTDISRTGAKFAINAQLQIGETIRLRLKHQEFDMEIAMPATVRWCHVKRDSWEAGVAFDDAVLADDVLDKLALDGVVERRRSTRYPVDVVAKMKTPGNPADMSIIVSDVSADGACIFSPTPIEIGKRLLLTLNNDGAEPVSYVAVSRWQKQQGAGYQLGCQLQEGQNPSILETCGVGKKDKPASTSTRISKRASKLTWVVLLVCSACAISLAYPNLGWPLSELQKPELLDNVARLWPW